MVRYRLGRALLAAASMVFACGGDGDGGGAHGTGGAPGGSGGSGNGAAVGGSGGGVAGSGGTSTGGTGGNPTGGGGTTTGGTAGASTGGTAGASAGGTAGASTGGTAGASTGGTGGASTACAAQISAAGDHTCARKANGTLWCWGDNKFGQTGDGTKITKVGPIQVAALGTNVADFSSGAYHTCARKTDGTLWCWGLNLDGPLGDGTTVDKTTPVQVAALGTSVAKVSAGQFHTCAIKSDGTLWCWGNNAMGQLGDGTEAGKHLPVQVAALGTSVANVASGFYHTCARKTDGTLWCWGTNNGGQLGNGTLVNSALPVQVGGIGMNSQDIVTGFHHSCARKTDGTLWCWGSNYFGQLGDVASGPLKITTPVQVAVLGSSVAQASIDDYSSCAHKTDGTLWCWGDNPLGLLGDGTTNDTPTPIEVVALGASVAEVSLASGHTCVRKTDGTLWCWGSNQAAQLGSLPIGGSSFVPVAVDGTTMGCP